jgi:ATP-dependent DNA ligase
MLPLWPMASPRTSIRKLIVAAASAPPTWIKPQLPRLVDDPPTGDDWLHEIKYDCYRMHARIDGGPVKLLTRTGLDWSHRYRRTIKAVASLRVKSAYLDGELCALNADGVPTFGGITRHDLSSISLSRSSTHSAWSLVGESQHFSLIVIRITDSGFCVGLRV